MTAPDLGPIHTHTVLATRKRLHVSPFNTVQGHYAFHVRETEDTAYVGIDYYDDDGLLLRTSIGVPPWIQRSSVRLGPINPCACSPWHGEHEERRVHERDVVRAEDGGPRCGQSLEALEQFWTKLVTMSSRGGVPVSASAA